MDELQLRLTQLGIQPMNADTYTPVPETELEQLEGLIGGKLPQDYRWFLTRYGESLFNEAVTCPASEVGVLPFTFFYGANASGDGVLANYTFYKGQFPKGIVPIGEASLGDLFLLAATGSTRGKVYYWCHDCVSVEGEEAEDGSGQVLAESVIPRYLELVAHSFTAFILGLHPEVD